MYFIRLLRPFTVLFVFINILFFNIDGFASSKHILILNSYEADYPATSDWFSGLKNTLNNNENINFTYSNEYFHLLYFGQQPDYLQEMARHIASKYKQHPPDLIISDSYLLSYFNSYLEKIFPNTKILCLDPSCDKISAYNKSANIIPIQGFGNEYQKNIPLILNLFPETKKIIVIVNDSYFGKRAIKDISLSSNKYKNTVNFVFTNKMHYAEMIHEISYSPPHTVIFFLGWNSYLHDEHLSSIQMFNHIKENTNFPIFTLNPYYIGNGAIGGYINHWDKLGQQTATISLDVLNNPSHKNSYTIAPINEYIFDWNQLNRWNISTQVLPINSQVKFEPLSFWQHYKHWLIIGCSIIIVQAFFIAFLLFTYQKRKKAELEIKNLNNNLENTIHQRTAQLQATIAELTNIKYTQDATNKYLIKLNQQLQTKAMTDELTGLYNRRYALEKLKQLIKNYNTNHTNFSLAITDIDFFKKFNDSYGHDTGDFVLISITQSMRFLLPNNFIVSRWGGEEFVILMPETNVTEAAAVLDEFRQTLAEKIWTYNLQQLHITMTFGITAVQVNDTADNLLKRADAALYSGKENGRNTIVIK
ncbi:GGDEF domain-containing protein [Pectinatus brassicae]|uniref:Diguanylate cyclase (GGDEF)-like protein n=1 Tax=Pectinatus brassicae TaxID=862415 RepID=A0A840URL2_9FIRM|nr:GGDEF domain-containing protein [Pectinatus brassicae]MBB5336792.1 diguanylate cyclase (GGDEF)-like protein [Pectinatus brassicae]